MLEKMLSILNCVYIICHYHGVRHINCMVQQKNEHAHFDFELAFTVQTFKNQLLCFSSSLPLIRHINQLCIVWLQIINTLLCSKCCYVVIKPLISKQFIVKCLCNHGNWSLFETVKYRRLML